MEAEDQRKVSSTILCFRSHDHAAHNVFGQNLAFGARNHLEELDPSDEVGILHQLAAIWRSGGRFDPSVYAEHRLDGDHVLLGRTSAVQLPLSDGALVNLQEFRQSRLGKA